MTNVEFKTYCAKGNLEMIKKGLKLKGVDTNHRNRDNNNAMGVAIKFNQFEVVKLLSENGVEIELRYYGDIARNGYSDIWFYAQNIRPYVSKDYLHSAMFNRHYDIAEYCIDHSDFPQAVYYKMFYDSAWNYTPELAKKLYDKLETPEQDNNKLANYYIKNRKNSPQWLIDMLMKDKRIVSQAVKDKDPTLIPPAIRKMFGLK